MKFRQLIDKSWAILLRKISHELGDWVLNPDLFKFTSQPQPNRHLLAQSSSVSIVNFEHVIAGWVGVFMVFHSF